MSDIVEFGIQTVFGGKICKIPRVDKNMCLHHYRTNSESEEPIFIHDEETKETVDYKNFIDCGTNNSNDNHGITKNIDLENISLCTQNRKDNVVRYYGECQDLKPCKAAKTNEIIDDNDIDSIEILISVNKETGELDFDVVSHAILDSLDRKGHAVLASTFGDKGQTKDSKGMGINFERDPYDVSLHTSKDQVKQMLIGPTLEITSTETCVVGSEPYYEDMRNVSPDAMYNGNSQIVDDKKERGRQNEVQYSGIYPHQADYEHNAIDRYPPNSGSRNWRAPHNSFNKGNQNEAHYMHYNNWKRHNYDRRNGQRYYQGYNRKGGYRNYGSERRDTYYKPKNVISFSESDLIYSSRIEHQNKNCNTPAFQTNKQITILKRGCTLDDDIEKKNDVNSVVKSPTKYILVGDQQNITADGDSIPYGNYSVNITSDRKYYSTKYQTKTDHTDDADVSGDTEEDVKSKKRKLTKGYKADKHKQKKIKKKVPKTRIEIYQNQLRAGQLKSIFSRWKSDGLKRVKLIEELHNGTFAIKYKAIYNNEIVVMSVYIDQDTSDINAIDMVHMRNSKFIDGIRDCITGPYSSLWLLTRYYHNGDLQSLLARDPERHVIGEVHAQFITAGLLFALDYLHQHGIVHGNIKPSKILISRNGYPVLTGYLIVDETMMEERRDVYTPAYAAPERFRGHRGTAIDIFSLGCVGYEIVTGRTPFDDGNLQTLRSNILDMSYRPLFEPELFSYAGEMLIDSCLRKPLKYRFRIGNNRENFLYEEWFSTLDLYEVERQNSFSPILQAMKQIEKSAILDWCEKTVDFNWGRALDITCPYIEPICKIDWHLTPDYFLEFV